METTEAEMFERALLLRADIVAGRLHGVNSRFAANILGAWLKVVREELAVDGELFDEETISRIERVYRDIEHRLAAH
jgi:hypothetical protein